MFRNENYRVLQKLLYILVLFFALGSKAFASIDDCLLSVETLTDSAIQNGLKVSNTRLLNRALASCQKAERQLPDSLSIKLALARTLIWSGKLSEAFVRLESVIDEEEESSELAAMICASKGASNRVKQKACAWVSEYGANDSSLILISAKQFLADGKVEEYINLLSQAAAEGNNKALEEAVGICLAFDPDNLDAITRQQSALRSIDPVYIAALACQGAFTAMSPDANNWETIGFNYATVMLYYNNFESVGEALLSLGSSTDTSAVNDAIWMATGLCMSQAGHPEDPSAEGQGVKDSEILIEYARPICEVAAYLNHENSSLHLNLSRIYELEGDGPSYYAALEEAIRLGNVVAHPFNPSDYAASDLLAAFYHGDIGSIYLLAPKNHEVVDVFYGKDTNMFLINYLETFVNSTMAGKEDFFCEKFEVIFTGKSKQGLSKLRFDMGQQMLRKMFGAIVDQQKGEEFIEKSFGAMFKNFDFGAMYDDWKTTTLNMSMAGNYGSRDGEIFVKKFRCEEPARPLVENIDAFIAGKPLPHRDLFYHSRYDKENGGKRFYDQCGNYFVDKGGSDLKASADCHCLTQQLYGAGASSAQFFSLAENISSTMKSGKNTAVRAALGRCEVI